MASLDHNELIKFTVNSMLLNVSKYNIYFKQDQNNGTVQDCSISTANALEKLQSCTKAIEIHFGHRYNKVNYNTILNTAM